MCRHCLRELKPNRGNVCLESGHYYVNYIKCKSCGASAAQLSITERESEEEEEEQSTTTTTTTTTTVYTETITYKHTCTGCGHHVADHSYIFEARDDGTQEYMMECYLCGGGIHAVAKLSDKDPAKLHPDADYEAMDDEVPRAVLEPVKGAQLSAILSRGNFILPEQQQQQQLQEDEDNEEEWE